MKWWRWPSDCPTVTGITRQNSRRCCCCCCMLWMRINLRHPHATIIRHISRHRRLQLALLAHSVISHTHIYNYVGPGPHTIWDFCSNVFSLDAFSATNSVTASKAAMVYTVQPIADSCRASLFASVIQTVSSKVCHFSTFFAHFRLPWVHTWDNRGKYYMDGKRIQCLSNALQHVPIYLQPFTSYNEILVRNCNFFLPPSI